MIDKWRDVFREISESDLFTWLPSGRRNRTKTMRSTSISVSWMNSRLASHEATALTG